nr:OPT/YSL family transporter [Melioribacteraceae bacterium]
TSQDLKTGYLVGATPIKQQFGLIIGVVASSFIIGLTLLLLNSILGIGNVTPEHPNPLPAPQATLMATVIKGLLSQNLPWGLVLVGMGIAAVMELAGVRSLPFAVGAYLPLSTSTPIFAGGLVKFIVDKIKKSKEDESDIGPGALFSSGLIAGGSLTGILIAILIGTPFGTDASGKEKSVADLLNTGIAEHIGAAGDLIALIMFIGLAFILSKFALSKEN